MIEPILVTIWSSLSIILSWLIRLGALIVVPFRRSVASARVWLLLFFIAPFPALALFLVLGRPEHSASRKHLFAKLPKELDRIKRRARLDDTELLCELSSRQQPLGHLAQQIGYLPPLAGNDIELISDYEASIVRLANDIRAASDHVHLEFYIFALDHSGRIILDALQEAAQRGVNCKILVDAIGSISSVKKLRQEFSLPNIEFEQILPFSHRLRSSRIDLRNHRKVAIIDGSTGYVGSQNIVDGISPDGLANRELMCRVQGPVVGALQLVFMGDWFLETQQKAESKQLFNFEKNAGTFNAQIVPSGPDYPRGSIDLLITNMIHLARSELCLVTPYFIPNPALVAALETAVLRGVKVTLILSEKSDSFIVKKAQESFYENLLERGITIQLLEANFLHSKHMRVDDNLVLIGSSNMDIRSFELNAEVTLLGYEQDLATQLKQVENAYIEESNLLELSVWRRRGLLSRFLENTMRMASDLL